VVQMSKENGETAVPENECIEVRNLVALRRQGSTEVREMRE